MAGIDSKGLFGHLTEDGLDPKGLSGPSDAYILYRATNGGLGGAGVVGDHGPEYSPPSMTPADVAVILGCDCQRYFTLPPMDGEMLWCPFHEDWYRYRAPPPPPDKYALRCESCDNNFSAYPTRTLARKRARTHALGLNGKGSIRPGPHHVVYVGTPTPRGLSWEKYVQKTSEVRSKFGA